MPDTSRLGLRRPEGADDFVIATDMQDIVDTLDDAGIYAKGTLAAIPAANTVPDGTLYRATDTDVIYCSTGAAWIVVGKRPDGDIGAAEIGALPVCVAYRAGQSINNGVTTSVDYTGADVDDVLDMHDPAVNSTQVYAPVDGLYRVTAEVLWAANATGYRQVLARNSATAAVGRSVIPAVNGTGTAHAASQVVRMSAGDYAYCTVYQTSGGALVMDDAKLILEFLCS